MEILPNRAYRIGPRVDVTDIRAAQNNLDFRVYQEYRSQPHVPVTPRGSRRLLSINLHLLSTREVQ